MAATRIGGFTFKAFKPHSSTNAFEVCYSGGLSCFDNRNLRRPRVAMPSLEANIGISITRAGIGLLQHIISDGPV